MARLSLFVLLACALPACGRAAPAPTGWRTCAVRGLQNGSGLSVFEEELVLVAGGNDRNIYALPRAALVAGGSVAARGLVVDVKQDAFLVGAERFSEQGYQIQHLWALPLDFQAVATRSPSFVFVGDRARRVVFWGRLMRDAGGRLARVRLDRAFVAPGASRSDAGVGDWRDKGPGLSGLVAPGGQRTEDLLVADGGEPGGRFLRVRKTDLYGSVLGGVLLEAENDQDPRVTGLSWHKQTIGLLQDRGATGQIVSFREIPGAAALSATERIDGPTPPAGCRWTGMAVAEDGTRYLLSDGATPVIAWWAP